MFREPTWDELWYAFCIVLGLAIAIMLIDGGLFMAQAADVPKGIDGLFVNSVLIDPLQVRSFVL